MKRSTMVILLAAAAAPVAATAQGHVHGEAALDIGIEGKTVTFEFRVPGDDLYGFEHEPRNAKEKATRDSAIALLKTQSSTLVQFDPKLGCKSVLGPVKYSAGKHVEVSARFDVVCQQEPTGHDIRFGITRTFPAVGVVRVQLVSASRQTGARIVKDQGVVRP